MEDVFSNDFVRGFLPVADPIAQLPDEFSDWEEQAQILPKLLANTQVPAAIAALPEFSVAGLKGPQQIERAMLLLSYFGHAYVWGDPSHIPDCLPEKLAKPWYEVSQCLGRPPILSYASYALYNWQRLDSSAPIALGNLKLLQNFLGGLDEEWFILVHIEIEAHAAEGLLAIQPAITAAKQNDPEQLTQDLTRVGDALEKMCDTLDRMTEHCDPYIYYNRVRPYIHGWKDNPALPNGLIYKGVSAYHNQPQQFKGETGAQSSIIPAFDTLLGIAYADNPLKQHLLEMRQYMPAPHRELLKEIEKKVSVREFVKQQAAEQAVLRDTYNRCIQLMVRFRITHLKYVAQYIQKQSQTSLANPIDVGTGGTPFMAYLKEHKEEIERYLL